MSNTAADVLAAARSEVGYTENPAGSNCTKFAAEAGHAKCRYWCATYTVALLKRCGVPIPPGADTASTRANLAAWKKAGQWVEPADVRAGDVLFFHISGRNGNDHSVPDHTGFARATPISGHLGTTEGNTSSGDSGSQDNGGGVFDRVRSLAVVIGAGRPAYSSTPPALEVDPVMFILNPVTDNDTTQFFVGLDGYVALTADEAQQFRNSGFGTRDMEPLAFKQFNQVASEKPRA